MLGCRLAALLFASGFAPPDWFCEDYTCGTGGRDIRTLNNVWLFFLSHANILPQPGKKQNLLLRKDLLNSVRTLSSWRLRTAVVKRKSKDSCETESD